MRLLQTSLRNRLTPQLLKEGKKDVQAIGYTTFLFPNSFDIKSNEGLSAVAELEFILRGLNMMDLTDDEVFIQTNENGTSTIGSGWSHNEDFVAKLLFAIRHFSSTLRTMHFMIIVQDTWKIQVWEMLEGHCVDQIASDGTIRSFARVASRYANKDADNVFEHIHESFSEKTEEEYREAGMDDIYDWVRIHNLADIFPERKTKFAGYTKQQKSS